MTRRVVSPALIGRSGELAAIGATMADAANGAARVVLLRGDAGIGKSRLVAEAAANARADGRLAVVGGCVQLGEVSLAYAPLVSALRELRAELGDPVLADLIGRDATDLRALLGGGTAPPSHSAGQLFEQVLGFLTRLGDLRPTLLVFEDVHWADASTRDLLAFLGRYLRSAAVTLLLTYRTDELHRRHPLLPLIASLERDPRVERITLSGLDQAQVAELVGGLSDHEADPETVAALLARTGGNPFYLEELVAAGAHGRLPATLTEVILARIGELSEPAQRVLRTAAVLGDAVDDRLLALVHGEPVGDALREAVAHQVLVIGTDGCRFRHALVRETLYEDLLPGERQHAHLAAATALENEPPPAMPDRTRWALLAHHWYAAHDLPRAFAASVRAGTASVAVHALADGAGHLKRALELWDQVPDPAGAAGMDRAELLLRTAEAVHFGSGAADSSLALVDAAYAALAPDTEPERRAMMLERVGALHWTYQRGARAAEAFERAARELADRPPSPERAMVLAALGRSLMLRGRNGDARTVLRQAVEAATATGAGRAHGQAACSLGPALAELGHADEAVTTARQALALCTEHGTIEDICRAHVNLTTVLTMTGRFAEASTAGANGLAYARRAGQLAHHGQAVTADRVVALTCAGEWAEAERAHAGLAGRVSGPIPYLDLRWLLLLLWAGRFDEADEVLARVRETAAGAEDVQFRALALLRAGELAGARGRFDEARSAFADGLRVCADSDEQYYGAYGTAHALAIEADRLLLPEQDTEAADRLIAQARALAGRVDALLPEAAMWLRTAEAEYARAHGRDEPDDWAEVATGWDTLGMPYPAACARYRSAAAALRAGDRAGAASVAEPALEAADRLGATALAAEIRALATRGRLSIEAVPAPRASLAELGVTPREREVLTLLAAGRSNRQIAESLVISEKTASVHVTNLLRKLGVRNRVDAAAVAQRLGF